MLITIITATAVLSKHTVFLLTNKKIFLSRKLRKDAGNIKVFGSKVKSYSIKLYPPIKLHFDGYNVIYT
ncbi:hypothetical protein COT49_01715 [candidate division WWE3 bacterium CG08_land_8_20_14_0_20_40_13]|uniref:Uncharacterized protein n=1 Tax=candidate division WWE3 bacterium CG08_land_8_20_14_0_20_40_13 TaxID=1975084 RepID=A0A2H0XDX1_UNCKA|nr:MAG: hypothetical protein COT49_01715 [candidate division WWE3 bacterium CG08_land_8_20_14_0_20_40_13]